MRRFYPLLASVPLAGLTFAATAHADDAELAGLLDQPVLTTASKTSEVGSAAPGTSTVISADDLRRYGIHTVAEALTFLALGANGGEDLGVRGVNIEGDQNESVLLLVDGHALNDPLYGGAPLGYGLGVPLELVDHIEFVLGPGSVLYGSNAMLGVINVITKRAKDFEGARVGAEANTPYGARLWAGAGHEFKFLGSRSEVTVALEYLRSNGPNSYYTPQYTGVDPVTGKLARYSSDLNGTGIWGGQATHLAFQEEPGAFVRFMSGNFEATLRARSSKTGADYSFAHFDDPTNRIIGRGLAFELKHSASLSPIVQVTTRLYADQTDSQAYFASSVGSVCPFADATCRIANVGTARWAGVEVQTTLDWRKDGTFVTLVGVDPRVRQAKGKTETLNDATGAALTPTFGLIDRTDATFGAYLQQTWKPLSWFGINGGARFDYDSRFDPVVSPRLAASVNVWRGGVLKAMYSSAFRQPSILETDFTHPLQIAATDLREESVRSGEISFEQKFGAQRLLFGAFRSTWTDLIHLHYFTPGEAAEVVRSGRASLPPISQFQNSDRIQNFGFNAGFEGTVGSGKVAYAANVTGAIARSESPTLGTVPLTASPRLLGNARVSYHLPGLWPTAGLAAQFAGPALVEGAYESNFKKGTYTPLELALRGTLTGDVPVLTGLSYRLSAECQFANRTDEMVGPTTESSTLNATPFLRPLPHFTSMVGLQYEF